MLLIPFIEPVDFLHSMCNLWNPDLDIEIPRPFRPVPKWFMVLVPQVRKSAAHEKKPPAHNLRPVSYTFELYSQ